MEPAQKTRLIGAAVLIALAVIIIPMFFSGPAPQSGDNKTLSLAIPSSPDQELTTRTMSVAPPARSSPATAASAAANPDRLATVNLPSRRPPEVHPENGVQPQSAPSTQPTGAINSQPQPQTPEAQAEKPPSPAADTKPEPEPQVPGQAANGKFQVSLGAYADSANARGLVKRIRKLGYGVVTDKVMVSGKPAARISAGPFATRAAAESARLRLKRAIPSAPATLVSSASDQHGDAAASAKSAKRAGGWAVQIGAYSSKADAQALRDKLRKAGFDGYVDDVKNGGRTLWRVRVGPQTQRADALKIRDQVKSRLKLPGVVVTVP